MTLGALVLALGGGAGNAAAQSAFCHIVDGTFTDCTPGSPIEEWSDVTGETFLNGGSVVYGDQNPAHTTLYLMYDYPLGTAPLGPTDCGTVEFDVFELNKLDHYVVSIGNCASNGFDVDVNGVKLPERLEEDIEAAYSFGPSPNSATPHQMYELSVPLVLVYQPDDPRFWTSGFPAPPQDPNPNADFDGDGVIDTEDNCRFAGNPAQEDLDNDGRGDACEACAGGDTDGDGAPDTVDDCPSVRDPLQRDRDGDGHGDRCDNCPKFIDEASCQGKLSDIDGDGTPNGNDNCTIDPNADQANGDADQFGDPCDPCPNDPTNTCDGPVTCKECFPDSDGDGLSDRDDNCRSVANADQADGDGDEVGDVCDNCPLSPIDDCLPKDDGDSDGLHNERDNCPAAPNPVQGDTDGDGFGDQCDPCPDDPDNNCVPCTGGGSGTGMRGPVTDSVRGHTSILEARSDGTTSNVPRSGCESPTLCEEDDPKTVYVFVKKMLAAMVKCAKLGEDPCDLSDLQPSGLSAGCEGVASCAVDSAVEAALGENNPAGAPVTDLCAVAVADNSRKFVSKLVANHYKGRPAEQTMDQEVSKRAKIESKCPDPLPVDVSLGNGCDGMATLAESLDCLFNQLNRSNPLP